jgi:hypothetical protein
MCFSLKLKNKKLPPFLAEIWDVHSWKRSLSPPPLPTLLFASAALEKKSPGHTNKLTHTKLTRQKNVTHPAPYIYIIHTNFVSFFGCLGPWDLSLSFSLNILGWD